MKLVEFEKRDDGVYVKGAWHMMTLMDPELIGRTDRSMDVLVRFQCRNGSAEYRVTGRDAQGSLVLECQAQGGPVEIGDQVPLIDAVVGH